MSVAPNNSPDESVRAEGTAHVNVTRIEISERMLSIVALVVSVVAIMLASFAFVQFGFTRRHVEELRIRTENAENTLIISGLTKPRDAENGPENNPDRLKRK